jgi:immunoglobulin-binding protein 1
MSQYLSQHATSSQSDDDTIRQLYLAEMKLYTHQTFQALDLISQELAILLQIRNLPQRLGNESNNDSRMQRIPGAFEYTERLDAPLSQRLAGGRGAPLLNREGKPLQPFTLTGRRTELQRGVFRSGHNLPTMSIDEYLEEERRRGGIIEGGEQPQQEIDEDDMDRADQETMKAREWDEFREANPRGSGNTLNRG